MVSGYLSRIYRTAEKISALYNTAKKQRNGVFNTAKLGFFHRESLSQQYGFMGLGLPQGNHTGLKRIHGRAENDIQLNRDFLAQLWITDRNLEKYREKMGRGRKKVIKPKNEGESFAFKNPFGSLFSSPAASEAKSYEQVGPVLQQPPASQSVSGYLKPSSPEEVNLCLVLDQFVVMWLALLCMNALKVLYIRI